MIIYKDIVSDEEIISDTFKLKEVDGIVYEADIRKVPIGTETFDTGANPSAEEKPPIEEATGGENIKTEEYDIVLAFRYRELDLKDPKERKSYYVHHIKAYMKKVVEALQAKGTDEKTIKAFQTGASKYVKKIVSNIKDYDLYASASDEPDGMVVLINYREDGVTPYVTIWKHGLTEMKV